MNVPLQLACIAAALAFLAQAILAVAVTVAIIRTPRRPPTLISPSHAPARRNGDKTAKGRDNDDSPPRERERKVGRVIA